MNGGAARWSMRTGRMRIANYKGTLELGAHARRLYLNVFVLFRIGHR